MKSLNGGERAGLNGESGASRLLTLLGYVDDVFFFGGGSDRRWLRVQW